MVVDESETFRRLIVALLLSVSIGCNAPNFKVVDGPARGVTKVVFYHRCYDSGCSSFDVSPSMQAVITPDRHHEFSTDHFEIRDIFLLNERIFVYLWNEYNSFIATIDPSGELTYLCDLHGVGHHALRSLDVQLDGDDLLVRATYGFFGEEKAARTVEKRIEKVQ